MQIYINKNGQQLGPFEEAKVAEMIQNGQLSPNDLGIRQGEQNWQHLGTIFPQTVASSTNTNPTQTKKGGKGCFTIPLLVFGLLLLLISSAAAFKNFNYSSSACYSSLSYEREALRKAEENTDIYQDKEEKRKKILSAKSNLGDAERKCDEAFSNAQFWKIAGIVGAVFGLILTFAGFTGMIIGRNKTTN